MDISAEVAAIQAASQGSELRQPLVGALNKLNSVSLPAVTASDAGKILKVDSNGEWVAGEKSGYMPVPTATKQIAENGTHDVTNYASANVNVNVANLGTKNIVQNGTYDASADSLDGYSSVIVDVQGGGSGEKELIHNVSVISASNIVTEFESIIGNSSTVTGLIMNPVKIFSSSYGYLHADLGSDNTSATIYGVCKYVSGQQPIGVAIGKAYSNSNTPGIYAVNGFWYTTVYGGDASSGKANNVFAVLALAVNSGTARFFINDDYQRTLTYANSGKYGAWGGGTNDSESHYQTGEVQIAYGALVKGVETDAEILANIDRIMTKYSNLIGT